jgi:hypothetical protein
VTRKKIWCKICLSSKLCCSVSRHLQEETGKKRENISGKLLPQSEPQTGYLPKTDGLAPQISHESITRLEEGTEKRCHMKMSVTLKLTVHSVGICRQLALYQGHDYAARHLRNVMAINIWR